MKDKILLLLVLLVLVPSAIRATSGPLQSKYTVALTGPVLANVTVLNITFNRPLTDDEFDRIDLFQPRNNGFFRLKRTCTYGIIEANVSIERPGKYRFVILAANAYSEVTVIVAEKENACELQAFGKCSQVCSLSNSTQTGYQCSCLQHYTLLSDQLSCKVNDPQPTVLYAQGNLIERYNSTTRQVGIFYNTTPSNSIDLFAYSYSNQTLYYADRTRELIASTSLLNPSIETILISSNIGHISGLSYDWISSTLYYTDSQLGTIKQYHSKNGYHNNGIVTTVLSGLQQPKAVTVMPDYPYRYMFWIEGSDIKRADLNGSNVVTIATVVNPVALTVDIVRLELYWISDVRRIVRSSFNGTNQETVYIGGDSLEYDSLSVFEDYIYVTDKRNNTVYIIDKLMNNETISFFTSIGSGSLSDVTVVHSLHQPLSLSDTDECLVNNGGCGQGCVNTIGSYYCTCIHGYMLQEDGMSCHDTDICNANELRCEQGCTNRFGNATCTCNHGYMLADDKQTCNDINECTNTQLRVCDDGCHNTIGGYTCSCRNGLFLSKDLHNCIGCSIANGGCSQLCVTSGGSFHCKCKSGFLLGSDGTSCFPLLSPSLFLSFTLTVPNIVGLIYETSLSGIIQHLTVPLHSSTLDHQTGVIYGMDTDAVNRLLYYGERSASDNSSSLWRTPLNDKLQNSDNRQLLLTNPSGTIILDVSYDWINNDLYWIEVIDDNGTIKKASLNNGSYLMPRTVYSNITSPRGLVINPLTNYLYWTEGGSVPCIVKGSTISPFSSSTLVSISVPSRPVGITIDYNRSRLLWGDQYHGLIEMTTLEGYDRTVLVNTTADTKPFYITINGDTLYWSSQGQSMFSSVALTGKRSILSFSIPGVSNNDPQIYGITSIDENKRPGNAYHVCLLNSLECSHYCTVTVSGSPVCTCPIGYVLLSDNRTCTSSELCTGQPQTCEGRFANTSTSIPFFSRPQLSGRPLNLLNQPIQWRDYTVSNCEILSVQYTNLNCQLSTVTKSLLTMIGSQLVSFEPDNNAWSLLNGRIVTVTLLCPYYLSTFCVNFEVSSASRAISCGHSNGGCSHFCTTSFSSIPICSCPHGLILGLDGYTCTDPCDPNPCHNGGLCQLSSSGQISCNCNSTSFTGDYCTVPSVCTTSTLLCTASSLSVKRYVEGDRIMTPQLSEGYCTAINGHCVGRSDCEYCQCNPSLIYQYKSESCVNIDQECSYESVYVSSSNYIQSIISTNNSVIVQSVIVPTDCTVSSVQLDAYNGWTTLPSTALYLTNNGSLKVNSSVLIHQLLGQLVHVSLTCSNSNNNGCILLKVLGTSQASQSLDTCNNCEGHFEGYYSTGVPSFPIPTDNDQPLINGILQYRSQTVQGCNSDSVTYYSKSNCTSVRIPNDTIYVTENRVLGRNIDNTLAWEQVAGTVINVTVSCQENTFCVLFKIQETPSSGNSDACSPCPCQNNGECMLVGLSGYHCSCPTGYTGPTCSEVDYCLSHTCLNAGTCINGPGYASCLCPEGTVPPYCIGPDDRTTAGPCLLSPCDNGGTCIEEGQSYKCNCIPGYTGLHCNTVDHCTSNSCPVNTTCFINGSSSYTCLCNEEDTSNCIISPCHPNPCMNQGTCHISNSVTAICTCSDGYNGNYCQNKLIGGSLCTNETCLNGGTCTNGTGTYTCTCPNGYTGQRCETDIDECVSSPCLNGGSCTDGTGTYNCACPNGYTGQRCETDIDECASSPCLNGGSCTDGTGTYTCACPNGYTGQSCETDIDECASSPCLNGGSCTDGTGTYTCTCPNGYTGQRCETDIDECASSPCLNGGSCTNASPGFTCQCSAGYTGDTCAKVCPFNRFGLRCEQTCSCFNHNNCSNINGACNCKAGYTGTTCQSPICDPPCRNGGTCVGPYNCSCPYTFRGRVCDELYCPNDYCNFRGVCSVSQYLIPPELICSCNNGFEGRRCEFQQHQLSGEQAGGLSAGVVIGLIILAILIVAAIMAVWKFYPYYRTRRAQRSAALWYLDSTLVHENPTVVKSLLDKSSSLEGIAGEGLDNPMYGTVKTEDTISIQSEEFQTSFSNYIDEQPQLYIPNTVIVNPCVDTRGRDSTSPSISNETHDVKITLSGSSEENIYDNV